QLALPSQPLSRARLARRRARALAAAGRALDSARATMQYDAALAPRMAPLLAAAEAGVDGELWLRLFDIDDDVASQRFVIMDRNGRAVASATLPAGLDVQQIGADYM